MGVQEWASRLASLLGLSFFSVSLVLLWVSIRGLRAFSTGCSQKDFDPVLLDWFSMSILYCFLWVFPQRVSRGGFYRGLLQGGLYACFCRIGLQGASSVGG